MSNPAAWVKAARLRTLPLALAGIVLGGGLAYHQNPSNFSWPIWVWSLVTAIFLQILSNYANDLGDHIKGTDAHRKDRSGGGVGLQVSQLKIGVYLWVLLSLLSGIYMLFFAYDRGVSVWPLFALGLFSVAAAIFYTLGKNAYGYLGLGDLSVFIFFGGASVLGSVSLQGGEWGIQEYCGVGISGFLSVAVLNINNIRDLETDATSGKKTLALRLGEKGSRIYLQILWILAFWCALVMSMTTYDYIYQYIWFLPFTIVVSSSLQVLRSQSGIEYNTYLKNVALGTAGTCLCLSLILFF